LPKARAQKVPVVETRGFVVSSAERDGVSS